MSTTQLRGSSQIQDGTIPAAKVDSSVIIADGTHAFTGDQSMGTHRLTNVADPSSAQDAATKAYVDATAQGLDVKASVRAASTGNVSTSSAPSSVDGVTLASGDRVLLKDQTAGSQNGVYTFAAAGSALTRATDADTSAKVTPGLFTFVEEGTANADSGWVLTTNAPVTLGTTALTFTQFSGAGQITAGAGMTKTGNTLDVVAADTSLTVNADSLQVNLADASLEVSSGLRVKHGTAGQVYVANASGVCTATTLSGDVSSVSGSGAVTLVATVLKTTSRVTRETPSGTVNGSNVTFTLANTPVSGTEEVYLNGIQQDSGSGNDYTVSSGTITMLTAPISGDKLRVSYFK